MSEQLNNLKSKNVINSLFLGIEESFLNLTVGIQ